MVTAAVTAGSLVAVTEGATATAAAEATAQRRTLRWLTRVVLMVLVRGRGGEAGEASEPASERECGRTTLVEEAATGDDVRGRGELGDGRVHLQRRHT